MTGEDERAQRLRTAAWEQREREQQQMTGVHLGDQERSGVSLREHGRTHVATPCVASEVSAEPPKKRLRGKQADKHAAAIEVKQSHPELPDVCLPDEVVDVAAEPSEGCFRVRCMAAIESPDPRVALERELRTLAGHLREHPTVPGDPDTGMAPDPHAFDDKLAVLLPPKHCAFAGCNWHLEWDEATFERDREKALVEHVRSAHFEAVRPVCGLLPQVYSEDFRVSAAYSQAIATKVRDGAPLASYSIDRRCLRKHAEATEGENIQALICFMCACTYPYRDREHFPPVSWCKPMEVFSLYGAEDTERFFGLKTYLDNYGADPSGFYDLRRHMVEFEDWLLDVPFGSNLVRVMCCPEDRKCSRDSCKSGRVICNECQIPLCAQCRGHVYQEPAPALPPAALSNDMMVFYAPEELYADGGLTVMEMICASPCITAMICFSMEVKYGHMLDSTVHMHRHRVGARGNATTFLLPWETVLSEMQRLDAQASAQGQAPGLPRTGKDLQYIVQVLQ